MENSELKRQIVGSTSTPGSFASIDCLAQRITSLASMYGAFLDSHSSCRNCELMGEVETGKRRVAQVEKALREW